MKQAGSKGAVSPPRMYACPALARSFARAAPAPQLRHAARLTCLTRAALSSVPARCPRRAAPPPHPRRSLLRHAAPARCPRLRHPAPARTPASATRHPPAARAAPRCPHRPA
ncbi:hypothetical protein GCM10009688_25040 [Arthrobacter gandavensis]|uniref:Uncharacterized protein n=1 Tax=Arthrobacter gandavensis TaxID=169960 RepID=A0ABP5AP04_9MICC